jgi:hypothetical protein
MIGTVTMNFITWKPKNADCLFLLISAQQGAGCCFESLGLCG